LKLFFKRKKMPLNRFFNAVKFPFFKLIDLVDLFYEKLFKLQRIGALLKVRFTSFKGREFCLPDGTVIKKGDAIGEIHLDSKEMSLFFKDGTKILEAGFLFLKNLKKSLKELAEFASTDGKKTLKAFRGMTLFHKGSERMGFAVLPIRNPVERFFIKAYLNLLMIRFHPLGLSRIKKKGGFLEPKVVWITRIELLKRFKADNRS
jgi:hypothetical protein